ncbi:hypothetical protein DEAC_c38850 [Desulfosporosinus acididurans]|uniref:Uncharacterized protein n=1 Tax=Desulfosporosinus acididurans TaxID=476652 RepID=A0A0J1FLL0_9FIRM|nr:hypothetical protein [Desulfosporosinus acididurans]KLU64252.1 hypothetical protein DEAC_c38850 [Desulfosporosinus acididurans]
MKKKDLYKIEDDVKVVTELCQLKDLDCEIKIVNQLDQFKDE